MAPSHRLNGGALCCWLVTVIVVSVLPAVERQADIAIPVLRYDAPRGFRSGNGAEAEAWVSDTLEAVIHVYPFRRFQGDFQNEFRRALFRDRISPPYREDRLLARPTFTALAVKNADAAVAADFKNFNGGVPRDHLRVAILVGMFVGIVDVSANSPEAFQRMRPGLSTLLNSLHVVHGEVSGF